MGDFFRRVWDLVGQIPPARVATYGQIAEILESPRAARTVGWALRALPWGSDVPWHRVVNRKGGISTSRHPHGHGEQRRLLEMEGVEFDERGHVDLQIYGWEGPLPGFWEGPDNGF
jgi:methylated-DNA-protein-cysteine methyltransferase-like protein